MTRCLAVGRKSSCNNLARNLREFRANFKSRPDLHRTSHIVQPKKAILFAGAVERVFGLSGKLWGSSKEFLRKFWGKFWQALGKLWRKTRTQNLIGVTLWKTKHLQLLGLPLRARNFTSTRVNDLSKHFFFFLATAAYRASREEKQYRPRAFQKKLQQAKKRNSTNHVPSKKTAKLGAEKAPGRTNRNGATDCRTKPGNRTPNPN